MSGTYSPYAGAPPQGHPTGPPAYPGPQGPPHQPQGQPQPRFPTYNPGQQRGPSPPQTIQPRPPGPSQYMQPHPGLQPGQVYTYQMPPGLQPQQFNLQYHIMHQPGQGGGPTYHPAQRGGPTTNVMQPGAPPFNPGQPFNPYPPHSGVHSGNPHQQVIYQSQHNGPQPMPGIQNHMMYGQQRFIAPAQMMQQMQGGHPGHHHGMPGMGGVPGQQQPQHPAIQQQGGGGPPQGVQPGPGPVPAHHFQPRGQQSQAGPGAGPGPAQPPHTPGQGPPGHQGPQPQLQPGGPVRGDSGPPDPASTPPGGPPSLGPTPQPGAMPSPHPVGGHQPHQGGTGTLTRERKRIAIIDPTTRLEVAVDGTTQDKPKAVSGSAVVSSTGGSNQPGDTPENGDMDKGSAKTIVAVFAEQVARAAGEGASQPTQPAEPAGPGGSLGRPGPETGGEEPSPSPEINQPPPGPGHIEPADRAPTHSKEAEEDISAEMVLQSKESLTVETELGVRSCDPLYEPVSPTPLPDSPSDETKPPAHEETKDTKPSPFEEVINKKAGVPGIERVEEPEASKVVNRKPKKVSAAAKKAQLNRAGEKGRDLLDVFTQETTSNNVDEVKVVKKSPTPEVVKQEEKVEEVNALAESLEKVAIASKEPVREITPPTKMEEEKPLEEVKKEEISPVVDNKVEVKAESPAEAKPKVNGIPSLLDNIPMELRRNDSLKNDSNAASESAREENEKEEGEITDNDDTEDNENEGKNPKLKYDYKEDQWSPLNPEGKKQYDREFLICLQRDPLSLTKPNNLPAMEIVKDKPNQMGKPQAGPRIDFTPGFVIRTSSQRGGPRGSEGPRGASRDGRRDGRGHQGQGQDPRNKPRMVISLPSISADVKLNKAENAWKPAVKESKEGKDVDQDETEKLKKSVLAILNKLTPQKFDTLVEKFTQLPIDSQTKLQVCMELIFEKALDEPGFSVAYAKMCQVLQLKKVMTEDSEAETREVNFRKLLISRCQKEFEKDYMESLDREKYISDMNSAETEDDRKQIKAVFEQMEMKLRRRSLGNIRFIGELYKLQMLTARIMHECVKKLLKTTDEESLECLCRLLTTVGQDLDNETQSRLSKGPIGGLNDLSVYFTEMRDITQDKKVCSRVRFLMQDVIELRQNGWKKRREEAGPKTIKQIHEDIAKEDLNAKLRAMAPSGPMPNRRDDRRDDRSRNDDRRRSQKGPDRGHPTGEEGWQAIPSRPARSQYEKIDTSKLKNITMGASKVDADSMSLGPPRAGGPGGWSRGSQTKGPGSRQQDTDQTKINNRFAGLDSVEPQGPPHGYDGRGSGGSSSFRFGRGSAVSGYAGRNSRGSSTEQDRGKPGQQSQGRDFGTRSQSVLGPHPTLSRENSAPRSASMVQVQPKAKGGNPLLHGDPNMSEDDVRKKADPLLEEYLHLKDLDGTIKEIAEKFAASTITIFVEHLLNNVIEKNSSARVASGGLLTQLLGRGLLSEGQFVKALDEFLTYAEDLLVDIPKFWDFIAQIVAPVLQPFGPLPLETLKTSAINAKLVEGDLGSKCAGGKYAAAVLHEMGKQGHSGVSTAWRESRLTWAEFLPSNTEVDQFVADNKLEWTLTAGAKGPVSSSGVPSLERLQSQLAHLLRDSDRLKKNDTVFDWIHNTIGQEAIQTPEMIRMLTTAVAESVIDGIGGPTNQCKLNEDKFTLRSDVLKKFVDNEASLELQVLLALQHVMHRLEHPSKLLHTIFEKLYDNDIISGDSFQAWEKNTDPAEQQGKGVALKSCTQFFTWLNEAEEENEEEIEEDE